MEIHDLEQKAQIEEVIFQSSFLHDKSQTVFHVILH